MNATRLLAVDLDRTLLPNGLQPESPRARVLFAALVEAQGIQLAYVSGRRLELVEQAIAEYELPWPDHVVADVGSSLYRRVAERWVACADWDAWLAEDWGGVQASRLAPLFEDESELQLQESAAQGKHKLSYYAPAAADALVQRMRTRLEGEGLRSIVVHSVDETRDQGLIDVLPRRSSKLGALEHLLARENIARERTVFAGDSGNDLEVLSSTIPSVLVANASDEVRARLVGGLQDETMHFARGGLFGMNGNYAAGILEGWLHYHPDDRARLERHHRSQRKARP